MAKAASVGTSRRGCEAPSRSLNNRMRIVVLILLAAVLISLFAGLFFVYKDRGKTNRAVISLTIRIALSIIVFLILIASYYFGLVPQRS